MRHLFVFCVCKRPAFARRLLGKNGGRTNHDFHETTTMPEVAVFEIEPLYSLLRGDPLGE